MLKDKNKYSEGFELIIALLRFLFKQGYTPSDIIQELNPEE